MLKDTSGGLDPSEVTEVAVKPIGSPSLVAEVIIATPEACLRKVAFSASAPCKFEKSGMFVISDKVRTSQWCTSNKGSTCVV
jgi:hypothetical protein